MLYAASAITGYVLLVVGFCWVWSHRPPPSMAERRADDAAQIVAIRRYNARQAYARAKAVGDTRAQHEAAKAVREATTAELKLVVNR